MLSQPKTKIRLSKGMCVFVCVDLNLLATKIPAMQFLASKDFSFLNRELIQNYLDKLCYYFG